MDSDVRMSTGEQAGGWVSSELVSGVGGAEIFTCKRGERTCWKSTW